MTRHNNCAVRQNRASFEALFFELQLLFGASEKSNGLPLLHIPQNKYAKLIPACPASNVSE